MVVQGSPHCIFSPCGMHFSRLQKEIAQGGIGGSVVEFSPATREARVRFPANATHFFFSPGALHKISHFPRWPHNPSRNQGPNLRRFPRGPRRIPHPASAPQALLAMHARHSSAAGFCTFADRPRWGRGEGVSRTARGFREGAEDASAPGKEETFRCLP